MMKLRFAYSTFLPTIALVILVWGSSHSRVKAQISPEISFDFLGNHTDFMFGFGGGIAIEPLDLSTRLYALVRPGRKRILIESETPNLYYQYRESRFMIGFDLEKRFTLTQISESKRVGAFLSAWGGLSLGSYRGTSASAPGGFNYIFRGGPFFNDDVVTIQAGYAFVPLRTPSIVAHRAFIGLHFTIE